SGHSLRSSRRNRTSGATMCQRLDLPVERRRTPLSPSNPSSAPPAYKTATAHIMPVARETGRQDGDLPLASAHGEVANEEEHLHARSSLGNFGLPGGCPHIRNAPERPVNPCRFNIPLSTSSFQATCP